MPHPDRRRIPQSLRAAGVHIHRHGGQGSPAVAVGTNRNWRRFRIEVSSWPFPPSFNLSRNASPANQLRWSVGSSSPADQRGCPYWSVSRSEEHTSELQSLMRISYAVFCLKKKNTHKTLAH